MKAVVSSVVLAIIPFFGSCTLNPEVASAAQKNKKPSMVKIDGDREISLKSTIDDSLAVLKQHGFRIPAMLSNSNVVVAVKSYETPVSFTDDNGHTMLVRWQDVQFIRPEGSRTEKVGIWSAGYYSDRY